MRIFIVILVVLGIGAATAWFNRASILMRGLPIVLDITQPIGPNVPVVWPEGPETAEGPIEERPPNIILILTDDLGFNDVSFYNGGAGDGSIQTPSIDAIASEGVVFTNGYAANAVCAPSRASIMTGRYSTRFGFEFTPFPRIAATMAGLMSQPAAPGVLPSISYPDKIESMPEINELGMPSEEITIAEVLKEKGYYNAHIGKWHLGYVDGMRPEDQGFDDSLNMSGTLYLPEGHPEVVNAKVLSESIERMVWIFSRYSAQFNGGPTFEPDGYLTDYYTNEAVKVIEANRNRPFFLYLAHWGIHNPLQALKSDYDELAHIENHRLRVYSAMIKSVDRSVERIMETLDKHGLSDNTLVVFTSDNGGAHYIHLPDINKPYRGWKLSHFEGGTHVPFFARWPARIEAGSSMDSIINHIDLFSTFAAAAGAELPDDRVIDGVDLLPYIRGEAEGVPHETMFWREGHQQTVQHQGWKLIRADRPDKRWLFDLSQDPTEQMNLADNNPDKVAELEALLDAHNAEQAEPRWPSVTEVPIIIDRTGPEPYVEGEEYLYWPN